jgi:hypothetical protein
VTKPIALTLLVLAVLALIGPHAARLLKREKTAS